MFFLWILYTLSLILFSIDTIHYYLRRRFVYRKLNVKLPEYPNRDQMKPMIGQHIYFSRLYTIKPYRREFNKFLLFIIFLIPGFGVFGFWMIIISNLILFVYVGQFTYILYEMTIVNDVKHLD